MKIRKASKKQSKLRVGLSAPSGAGKTLSSLLIAGGMADWDKIALIDTENGSGDQYANNKEFKIGEFNIITLKAPFSPERYIEAIETCEDAGMDIIIIDSVTHEWEGSGGCLEINEKTARSKFKGNTWSAWSDTGIRHQKFLNKIVQSTSHVITTVRNKVETSMEGGKVIKLGTKEVTREGFEYELTVNFDIDRSSHMATPSKDRTSIFEGTDGFLPSKETGKQLIAWAMDGEEVKKPIFDNEKFEKNIDKIKDRINAGEKNKDIIKELKQAFDVPEFIEKKILAVETHEPTPGFDDEKKVEKKIEKKAKKKVEKKEVEELDFEDDKKVDKKDQSKINFDNYKEAIETSKTVKELKGFIDEIQELIDNKVFNAVHKKKLNKIFADQELKLKANEAFDLKGVTITQMLKDLDMIEDEKSLDSVKKLFTKNKDKLEIEEKNQFVSAFNKKLANIKSKTETEEEEDDEEETVEEDGFSDDLDI